MNSQRRGEIDRIMVKNFFVREREAGGFTLSSRDNTLRVIRNVSQITGVPVVELLEYMRVLALEFFHECLPAEVSAVDTDTATKEAEDYLLGKDGNEKPKPGIPLGEAFANDKASAGPSSNRVDIHELR